MIVRACYASAENSKDSMNRSDIVVCSFHSDDEYYRGHANILRSNLSELGIAYEIEEIHTEPDEDWADVCRKKVAIINRVCEENPQKRVFWIDVDCTLLDFPSYVGDFSADFIGFQRGFSDPSMIGYAHKSRFWEPCFFGINTSPGGRKFIADAAALERTSPAKATDDFFFEESWRANGAAMSFQVIPSQAVLGRNTDARAAFFSFGSSGNVAEFKGKVVQHASSNPTTSQHFRKLALSGAKRVEKMLSSVSAPATQRVRRLADSVGVTHLLTQGSGITGGTSKHRTRLLGQTIVAAQQGREEVADQLTLQIESSGITTAAELSTLRAAKSFATYMRGSDSVTPIPVSWWARPFPGNFGDWLGPLLVRDSSQRPVRYIGPTAPHTDPHLFTVGSIGRFIKRSSIVVGTGLSTLDTELNPHADYVSVRGPLTAQRVRESGGPGVQSFGDPGVLLSRFIPVERTNTNGRIALVRHFTHAGLPLRFSDEWDELSVMMSHPDEIAQFVAKLNQYDAVVTSAMHVMIVCHSYGIPCALISFTGFESSVHGTGIKYRDYSLGAGLDAVHEPTPVPLDLRKVNFDDLIRSTQVSKEKLDEVTEALNLGINKILQAE